MNQNRFKNFLKFSTFLLFYWNSTSSRRSSFISSFSSHLIVFTHLINFTHFDLFSFIMIDNARRRDSNLKWNDENVDVVVQWLCIRDERNVVVNLKFYQTDNKIETARRLQSKTHLRVNRSDISKKKVRDKIEQMIRNFKAVKQMTKTIEWEVNVTKHNVVVENSRDMIIKDVLLKKCSYYYEFEELLEDSSIITSSFTLEFTRSVLDEEDAKNSKNETKNETNQNKNKNKKNETNQNKKNNIITQNVNDKNYVNWINFDINDSDSDDFLMKNSLTSLKKTFKINSTKRKSNDDVVKSTKRFKTKKAIHIDFDSEKNRIRSKQDDKERQWQMQWLKYRKWNSLILSHNLRSRCVKEISITKKSWLKRMKRSRMQRCSTRRRWWDWKSS